MECTLGQVRKLEEVIRTVTLDGPLDWMVAQTNLVKDTPARWAIRLDGCSNNPYK